MKIVVKSLIALAFILTACAPAEEKAGTTALYDKYNAHCREHAEKATGSPDVEGFYQECMDYFVGTDINCPYCNLDPHMEKKQ